MSKMAVDVVLLPSERMMERAIEANRDLPVQAEQIVLSKADCLPHVSLAMGCIDASRIAEIEAVLGALSQRHPGQRLRVAGLRVQASPAGRPVSAFVIEKAGALQSLHEDAMLELRPYFSHDVTAEMVLSPPEADESTLLWIRNYRELSSFENFRPHITIGYGRGGLACGRIEFSAPRLALCHLGNHCTCRKVLLSAELRG